MTIKWEFQIQPKYSNARSFSDGLAAVETPERPDRWGFIDKIGNWIVKPSFEFIEMNQEDEKSGFSQGFVAVADEDLEYWFITGSGQPANELRFEDAGNFSEGLAKVKRNDRWGFIDRRFQFVIPPRFEDVQSFSDGLACARSIRRGKWGFIEPSGKFLIPEFFEEVGSFSGGLAPARIDNKWGYIDSTGKFKIEPKFESAGKFKDGLAPVELDKKLKYINKTGTDVFITNYRKGFAFSDGLAAVALFDYEEEARMNAWADKMYKERGILYQMDRSSLWKWGFIDKTGVEAIPPQFIYVHSFSEGMAAVMQNKAWGYIRIF